jgi:tRNA(Ile2) C34 agmatinyltransferase TiaS
MIYLGIDDTDTLDDPGTNQLARHLVKCLAGEYQGRLILRHQLLEDPRVPCTRKNGCASILLEPFVTVSIPDLADRIRQVMLQWCPVGSDPGLCISDVVPDAVVDFGRRCQRELVRQQDAFDLVAAHQIYLEGLGGTNDGVIGALAAIGLLATKDDGRVIYCGSAETDLFDVSGWQTIDSVHAQGVTEIRSVETRETITTGCIDVGKRLRPNFRQGKVVLFAASISDGLGEPPHWQAVRVT